MITPASHQYLSTISRVGLTHGSGFMVHDGFMAHESRLRGVINGPMVRGPGHSSGIILNHPYPGYPPSVPSHVISNLKHHALSCVWTLGGAARGPAMGVSSGSGLASSRLGSRRRLLALQRTLWRLDLPLLTCVLSQVVQGRSPPQAGNGRWMRRASFIEYHSRSGAWVAIGMLRSEGCWGFPFLKNKFKLV